MFNLHANKKTQWLSPGPGLMDTIKKTKNNAFDFPSVHIFIIIDIFVCN